MQLANVLTRFDRSHLQHLKGVGTPLLILAALAMIVLPMPPILLDILFSFNIALALVVLLVTIYVNKPLDFAYFSVGAIGRDNLAAGVKRRQYQGCTTRGAYGAGCGGRSDRGFRPRGHRR